MLIRIIYHLLPLVNLQNPIASPLIPSLHCLCLSSLSLSILPLLQSYCGGTVADVGFFSLSEFSVGPNC